MTRTQYPFFFTWSSQKAARPVPITGGSGAWFETEGGERWLDFGSLSYQASLGHGERRVTEAIVRQAESLCISMPAAVYPAKTELAERLLELAPPGFSKVFFTLGGSEANENAIKMARLITGRYKVLSRYRSYHGATMGALSLSGDWRRPPLEPGIPGVVRAMDCYCQRCPFGQKLDTCSRECAIHIDELLDLEGAGTVGAVILEPIPGANGVLVPPPEYWPMVREACHRHGALLIADEVLTGFGRTGTCFAYEQLGATPDVITVAKAITGGYAPLGAVLVHERVAGHFEDHVLACGLTQYAHPLGCAAGLAALDVYRDDDLFARAARLGPRLLQGLRDIAATSDDLGLVRGLGLLAAIEWQADVEGWERLAEALRRRHLFVHIYPDRGTLVLAPPLMIPEDDLEHGLSLLAESFNEVLT
jgi:taurine--2-oxoglutarate transaminase